MKKKNLIAIAKKFKFTDEQSARMIGLSLRTFRTITPTSDLSVLASEMVIRLSELYECGVNTFGNSKSFILWLNSDIPALGYRKPILLIESGMGVSIVINLLTGMEYGVVM
ncbi:MAG TPA: antitoxin Xre/MbcA/ParS toxin-binding domain-containing protein [Cyclobacteriaceae bacterium]|nr:antitoxin Xre/MbcA/ParS toxin-binding domain-containing protein [Cyclobacteriaceae bacterium]